MGADPGRVRTRADLVRELEVLRGNAARGSGRARVSLADLAKRVDVPRSTLHTYLTGQSLVPAEVLDRTVIALGGTGADQRSWAEAWDRVAAHEHQAKHVQAPEETPRQLPAAPAAFTGRAEQLASLDALQGVAAIIGAPGVGKTALALHWAHRNAHRFPDGQLYLNLRGYDPGTPVHAADAAAALLRALHKDAPPGLDERAASLRSALAGRRVLVLLDNAGSAEQVRPLLAGAFTIITSRDALAGLAVLDGAGMVDLDVLRPQEALQLLKEILGARVDYEREAASRLAELCGHLPLALKVAAEFARHEPLHQAVEHLTRERLDLLDSSGDPRTMIRAVFSWSYRRLAPEAAELFRLLGNHPGRDFDVPAAAALADVDFAEAARRIDLLVRASLVQGNGRYEMHDLLRDYSRELATTGPAVLRLIDHYVEAHSAALALAYPHHSRSQSAGVVWLQDAGTARAWLTAEADNVVEVVGLAAGLGLGTSARQLAEVAKRHLDTTSRGTLAMRMHHLALESARRDGDLAGEAEALRNLGVTAETMGAQLDAIEWLRRGADIWRRLGDQRRLARALSSLGISLGALGRFDESIAAHEQVLEINRGLGETHRVAAGQLNLGVVLEERGELARALANHRAALETFQRLGDRLGVAHALTNIGNVLIRLGELDEAGQVLGEALTAYREVGSRVGEVFVTKFLGSVHEAREEHHEASAVYEQALGIVRETGDLKLQAELHYLLGFALGRAGQPAAARHAHHEALALATELGFEAVEAAAFEGLGEVARDTGAVESARRHWTKAAGKYEALGMPDAERLRDELSRLVQLRPEQG